VAVDAFGNVYVGDTGNNAVKEIPAAGGAPITLVRVLASLLALRLIRLGIYTLPMLETMR